MFSTKYILFLFNFYKFCILKKIYAPLRLYLPAVVCYGVYNIATRQALYSK